MSAIVTTAPLESVALENGVTMSPTFALLDRITPSNGARISVCSTRDLGVARVRLGGGDAPRCALATPATARSGARLRVSSADCEMKPFASRSCVALELR